MNDKKINSNLIEANIKLQDENKTIKKDNIILNKRIQSSIEYIKKSMNNCQPFYEYLYGDENGKVQNLDELLNILEGE